MQAIKELEDWRHFVNKQETENDYSLFDKFKILNDKKVASSS